MPKDTYREPVFDSPASFDEPVFEEEPRVEKWDKNHLPLNWQAFNPAVLGVALKAANKAWQDGDNEEDAIEDGAEAARDYSRDENIALMKV